MGSVVPKARPRFSSRDHVHTSTKYAQWKRQAVFDLRAVENITISGLILQITFVNALRGNSDCDNAAGAIMDALVESKVLPGDSVTTISKLVVENHKEKKKTILPQTLIEISANHKVNIDRVKQILEQIKS